METHITERTPVEFELEITADSGTLEPRIDRAMRRLRGGITMKGFRPGKVPLNLVRRMYGKEVAREVVDEMIQETYESSVLASGAYTVMGPPTISAIDYEPFGDLRAVVEFGVRPEFELADLAEHEVLRLTHEVTEEEIDDEVKGMLDARAEMVPHEDPAGEEDVVYVDLQRLDLETGVPIVGESEKIEDIPVYLGNEHTVEELKQALTGRRIGDVTQVVLPPPEGDPEDGEPEEPRRYEVTVQDIKRRELPELDDEFVEEITNGEVETVEGLREEIRQQLENRWRRQLREDFEGRITDKMLELHPMPVPASAKGVFLDAFVADVKRQNEGELPEEFDEAAYREERSDSAAQMVRWMVIRDRIVEEAELNVTNEEMDAELEEMGSGRGFDADLMRRLVAAYDPEGLDKVERQVLDRKIYDALAERLQVVEKTWEEFIEERRQEQDA